MNPQPKPRKDKRKRHRMTIACDISQEVKTRVFTRDSGRCIICGNRGQPNAHFIPRSQGGLGIDENIVTLCEVCHQEYDNGFNRELYGRLIEEHLKQCYFPYWDRSKLIYDKWNEIDPRWRFDIDT